MGKVEANNEIVRMRQFVRQARVCIIHKLTREAKTLRTKSGTEKQQEKNKKKADKLIGEIYALKKIKDDHITKFGINNKKSVQEILQNKNASKSTRIMARVVDYKSLKNAIVQFRETYPDYEEYLKPGKKKSTKVKAQQKEGSEVEIKRETRASAMRVQDTCAEHSLADESISDEGNSSNVGINEEDTENSTVNNNLEQNDSEPGSTLRIKPPACVQTKCKENKRLKRNRKQSIESVEELNDICDDEDFKGIKKVCVEEPQKEDKEQGTVKIISKQATVKRFTELLQEQSSETNASLKKDKDEEVSVGDKPETEKEVDPFFMSGDGEAYLSVAKSTAEEQEDLLEEDNNYDRSKRHAIKRTFANDRFFNNVKSIDTAKRKGKQRDNRQNDNDFIRNKGSFRNQRDAGTSSLRSTTIKYNNDARTNSNENENLHPSWAAKKKQQEIVKQGFQGKKIIFSDE